MTFFCIKFSIYAIMLWMPLFLSETLHFDNREIANLLTYYELATLFGTSSLGPLTDFCYGKRTPVAAVSLIFASIVAFILTFKYDELSEGGLTFAMICLGFFLGSIYHMINVTCCADLGKEQHGKSATATIAGIVDGCGSLGTGTGMLILGIFIDNWGYRYGFLMIVSIMISCTLIPLSFILKRDLAEIQQLRAAARGD